MTLNEARQALAELEANLYAYNHAMSAIYYDAETVAPANSAEGRGRALSVLGGAVHALVTAPRAGEIADTLLAGAAGLDLTTRRRAEELKEARDELTRVPADEYAAYQALLAEAGAAWHAAKPRSDFAAFAPCLERIIDFNRRFAALKDADRPAYDVLLDTSEKGLSMAALDPFFALLRRELTPLILAVGERPRPDDAFARRPCPIGLQRRFTDRLMALMGLDRADCAVGETEHPFTDGFNRHDVRITTHYHEDSVLSSMYSVIHEGGHALYELGVGEDLQWTLLGGGSSMSVHESQSRFYENLIGRSRPFCRLLLPLLRESFPGTFEDVTEEALYRGVNLAAPSLIRTEADELTYSTHVMIRYELEKAMFSGALRAKDIPGEWNRMYREYLGVEVPDDRRGCLQDSHWSSGLVGYFPSYALGSAYGVQMLENMERDVDVWGCVARGDLGPVTAWLGERIHRHGRRLLPAQLIESACGGPFEPRRYTDYLKRKFSALYGL